jgi:hypothetical protein
MMRADVRILVRAAERLELTARVAGNRNGPLGHIGLEIMRELARMIDHSTGQLDPSYDCLARNLRRSRSAIIEGVKRLRDAGLLDWVRRFEPSERRGERGPQVRQVSNAYRLCVPEWIKSLLGPLGVGAPPPDDDEFRRNEWRDNKRRWEFEDSPLFAALDRLRMAVERESATRSESPNGY